ncbi:hypothetical protein [Hyphomicrobium sulfonivorans]|uniref:hypothetical protein n=1 Tax=Hyphomicrobium sulfonivorans TaxID=121290 RepID=UPI001570D4DD|nr:hypothetical protein [Hyphomicrobium sulfonivorans]MBI1650114.1 hypothetical protein [Hyphomicrobium sulfonivorans]
MTIHIRPPQFAGQARTPRERDIRYRGALRIRVRDINAEIDALIAEVEQRDIDTAGMVERVLSLMDDRAQLVRAGGMLTGRIRSAGADDRRGCAAA